jgi:two-component system, NtrC family, response regulator PilR
MLGLSPVLIVSGESDHSKLLAERVSKAGLRPICCETIAEAQALLAKQQFSAIVCNDFLTERNLRELIYDLGGGTGKAAAVPIVIVSRRDDWDSFLTAVGAGAFDYVAFPPNPGELERVLWAALSESKRSEEALTQSAA